MITGLNLKPLTTKLQPLLAFVRKDLRILFLLIVAAVFGYLIWRIGILANAEPSQDEVSEKLLTVVRPKIDQEAIKKIEELQARNVDISATFPPDRSNPFHE